MSELEAIGRALAIIRRRKDWQFERFENGHIVMKRLTHDWIDCVTCGLIRPACGFKRLCRGPVRIDLR